jgi:hypothetical protein
MEWTTNVHICKDLLVILSVYLQIRELGLFQGHVCVCVCVYFFRG